jgi:hypothetical protein
MLRRQPRDLGLTSSTACLPLPHKPKLQDQTHQQGVGSITRSTSVESALHSLPKSSDSGDDGWIDENMAELEKELGLAWESNKWSHQRPAHLPPQVLARPRHHRTRSRVENAAKPLVVDQKSCEMLVDVVPQLRTLSGSSGRLGWL